MCRLVRALFYVNSWSERKGTETRSKTEHIANSCEQCESAHTIKRSNDGNDEIEIAGKSTGRGRVHFDIVFHLDTAVIPQGLRKGTGIGGCFPAVEWRSIRSAWQSAGDVSHLWFVFIWFELIFFAVVDFRRDSKANERRPMNSTHQFIFALIMKQLKRSAIKIHADEKSKRSNTNLIAALFAWLRREDSYSWWFYGFSYRRKRSEFRCDKKRRW